MPPRSFRSLRNMASTRSAVPPTIYRMLILADLDKFDFSELRHCVSAGEPLNPEVIKAWKDATGLTIYEGYGQTETVLCVGTFPGMQPKFGSMGKPSPGWQIELHDDHGKPVPVHEEGRIAIRINPRPVGMFREYLNNPEENKKSFVGDWYYTGDKAYRDEDGYLWFIGRDDDVIKASGYRIGPFEVESALIEHPAVQEAAVVGSPDDIRGLIVKAFIILKPGYQTLGSTRARDPEPCQEGHSPLQVPACNRVRGNPPQDHLRQDPAQRAARPGVEEIPERDWWRKEGVSPSFTLPLFNRAGNL